MPCWTVAESTVNLQNADEQLLRVALEKLGFENFHSNDQYAGRFGARFTADRFGDSTSLKLMADGSVTVTRGGGSAADLNALGNEIKRGYSGEVLNDAASRFGWMLKPTGDRKWQVMGR